MRSSLRRRMLVIGVVSGAAATVTFGQAIIDLDQLTRPGTGRSHRVSSHDADWQDGNHDWREIAPGETLTLAELDGPGIVRHIWFTVNADDLQYPRSCVLRMYWDGSSVPSVETPLGDFFAVGHGMRRELDSAPVAITSEGRAYNCYWSMPFKRNARITVTNDSAHPVGKFYYYIDYDMVDELPGDAMYFHARYRQEWPVDDGDYLICRTTGRGHYVGTVLSVQITAKGWFGEGDDRIYIDGDAVPGMHGTGTEDYFCDAWGFREFNRPYYGVVLMEGFAFGDRLTVYRWHIADPIRFERSFRFEIEHKGSVYDTEDKMANWHGERPDLFSSVAFWYQDSIAEPFAEVPTLDKRLVPTTRIELERFADKARATAGEATFKVHSGSFSGAQQLLIDAAVSGTIVSLPFELKEALSGAGRLTLTTSISNGTWRVSLDGEVIPTLRHRDLYDKYYTPTDFNIGYVELAAGPHELTFECLGKRAAARAHQLGADVLKIEPGRPFRVPTATQPE